MKKHSAIPALLLSFLLIGCASTPTDSASQAKADGHAAKSKSTDRFDDWKYKGFGMTLPDWVEAAVDGKSEKAAKSLGYAAEQIEIFTASGINVDQSESKLQSKIPQEKPLIDGFWVRINRSIKKTSEPYITVLVYEK